MPAGMRYLFAQLCLIVVRIYFTAKVMILNNICGELSIFLYLCTALLHILVA